MMRVCWMGVVAVGLLAGWTPAQSPLDIDEQTLRNSKLPTSTAGLIDFFQQRSLKEGDAKVLQELVRQLGSDVYRIREPAAKQLIVRGPAALPFLKAALNNAPLETKRRAETCMRDIEATMQNEPIAAAARVLATRKDTRAAEVLFNFLPTISNDPFLEEEIVASVGRLTVTPGKVDPLIVSALKDPLPFRRAVAVYLLGRRGDITQRATLRQLLEDADPLVQQRAGLGLLGKRPSQVVQEAAATDEMLLRTHFMPQKLELADACFQWFQKATLKDADQQRLRSLVKDLGKGSYSIRVAATKSLLSEGTPALPFLKQVEFDPDVELSRRARFCIDEIQKKSNVSIPMAAAHWLARTAQRKDVAAKATRILLDYVPFADDDLVEEEVLTSLTLLCLRETNIDPAVRQALKDPLPARRAAAAYVLGHVGLQDDLAQVQALLDDLHPVVRLRAAQGLLAARDRSALPCLVQLLKQAPAPYLGRVEDPLYRLADGTGPNEPIIAASLESRQKAVKLWEKWLADHDAKIDLANLGERDTHLGLITICEYDNRFGNIGGQVFETSRSDQKRWTIAGVQGAMDAHTLPNGRVLIAENNARRITERDAQGNVKWEYNVNNNPICCQRLPNGNTFIASYNMVMEVRPNKEEVYRYTPGPQFYIFSAHKARNGNIIAITAQGQIIEMDSKNGQTLRTVQTNTLGNWCSVELLPNNNFLVACMSTNNVREINRSGATVWSKEFQGVFRATRMPNGNVLVASMSTRQVAEIDRGGAIRWKTTCAGRPWSVHYR